MACEKATLEDQVATLEDRSERLKDQDVREACEALGFEKRRQLSGFSTSSGKSKVLGHGQVASRAKEVNTVLTSFVKTDFAGLFRLGELGYDGFHQFCGNLSLGGSSSDSKG
ncbi:unnamed protein product [Lactuca saligna]|uniref:Uncharacterized protein n=1 Tax=Lactuca saligna TaxID=75948 RepID=A0AA35YWR4_LACSI|nr:unnamed protein product [Lactuca saligna]